MSNIEISPQVATEFIRVAAPHTASALRAYATQSQIAAIESLGPKLNTLIRLVIALVLPSRSLMRKYLSEAKRVASDSEIAESIMAAAALRAGGAIGYGRLAFKLLERKETQEPGGDRSQIQSDREYMTQLRKAHPASFDQLAKFMAGLHSPDSALPAMHYELMAVAGATITQCVYCLEKHVNDARKEGATDRQIADVIHMAVTLRADSVILECDEVALSDCMGGAQ